MKKHLLALLLLVSPVMCASAAEAGSSPAEITPASGDTFVFLGDSITAQLLYTQYIEDYFYTRYPHLRLNFHNAGVSGDTTADALARFDRDVAAYHPKYVTVLLGMNDGASKQFEPALFDTYRTDMRTLVGKIKAIGATPILITPTMYDVRMAVKSGKNDSRGRGGYYNGVLALYGAWLRELAGDDGEPLVDMYEPINRLTLQSRKSHPEFSFTADGIHPDAGGHMIMASAFASDLGLPKCSSTIELARAEDGGAMAKATGGKVTDEHFTGEGLEFKFQPTSLPMPVPTSAKEGANLIPPGQRLSSEVLRIHGLAPGNYRLLINDNEIGVYAAAVLESELDLDGNARTPQNQQAGRVADLNAQRNEQVVAPLRDLWRAKKTLERTKRELAAAPADEALKKRAFSYERKLHDFDGQIEALDAKSKTFEDQIYQANQPQLLSFRLERVQTPKP
jgi:lysophospholipase L1-like esterase